MANIFEKEYDKETLFKDRNLITPHHMPPKLLFREKQIEDLTNILGVTLKGKKANNVFIFGVIGSGKTSVAKYILKQLIDFSIQKNANVEGTYINCRNHNSKYRVLMKVVKDFYPEKNFLGFSASFIHEKLLEYAKNGKEIIIVMDEIDNVKDIDDLIYGLTRANDELEKGSISVIGISNNLMFKDKLGARTKSSLCEEELIFPPYNADELVKILKERIKVAFKDDTVTDSAINLAAAYAAQESGDARTALMLMLRAGEIADKKKLDIVSDDEVKKAKSKVEEEIIFNMISTLPDQQKLVLYAIADLCEDRKTMTKITGEIEHGTLYSGEVYDNYSKIAKKFKGDIVTARWYREYINELETYGLIHTIQSGKGTKGQTRFIKLGYSPKKILTLLKKEFE